MAKVTRESLQAMLNNDNPAYVERVIGRALIALFQNQTQDERSSNATNNLNGIGFTGADGRSGALTAKYFMKHGKLLDWQVEAWKKPAKNGFSRLTKYAKQLNQIAELKATSKQQPKEDVGNIMEELMALREMRDKEQYDYDMYVDSDDEPTLIKMNLSITKLDQRINQLNLRLKKETSGH